MKLLTEIQSKVIASLEEKYKSTVSEADDEKECPHCEGAGYHETEEGGEKEECSECEGSGMVSSDEPEVSESALEEASGSVSFPGMGSEMSKDKRITLALKASGIKMSVKKGAWQWGSALGNDLITLKGDQQSIVDFFDKHLGVDVDNWNDVNKAIKKMTD